MIIDKIKGLFVSNRIQIVTTKNQATLTPPTEVGGAEGNDSKQSHGGRLQNYYQVWTSLACHPRVVQVLQNGYRVQTRDLKLSSYPNLQSGYKNPEKQLVLTNSVQDLLEKDAIVPVLSPCTTRGFYSRLFLVPKPQNKWRPVIDLSVLNRHLSIPTFKMETAEIIRNSLRKGEWVTSLDLKDAYFHIPIHEDSQPLLRFQVAGLVYQFKALPFGLATAPLEFTRVVREVKFMLQAKGIRIHQYLDDWLLRAQSKQECLAQTKELVHFVQKLGLVINFEKSELEPQQKVDFLGYRFDLELGKVFPTQKKLEKLKVVIQNMELSPTTTPRQLMSLIGIMASIEKTVPMGRLHMRPLQWYLRTHYRYPQSLDITIQVNQQLRSYLVWWKDPKNLSIGSPLHPQEHNVLLFCDSSNLGWGAHIGQSTCSGLWSIQEKNLHINILELKAVYLALKHFCQAIQGQTVLIASDNSTVVSYLNKEGGTKSWEMCLLVWRIMSFCHPRNIQVRARHIQGSLNVVADNLSRRDKIIQTEWSLHPRAFQMICQHWGTPMIDMFATRYNNKLPLYISPVPDANATDIDALNISWEGLDGYVYCPVALIQKVIQKMNTYRCRMIVVAPGWPGMPWFWDLVELSTKPPLQLPQWPNLLKQSMNQKLHQNLEFLNLHVWHLDTSQSKTNSSLNRWKGGLRHLNANPPGEFTHQGGPYLNNGARRIRWTAKDRLSQI